MAYDDGLAERVREQLADITFAHERRMFGGLVFFINGNMLCAVMGEWLMARVGPAAYADALRRPHTKPMDFTGRALTGFVYVTAAGVASDTDLAAWLERAIAFAGALPPRGP